MFDILRAGARGFIFDEATEPEPLARKKPQKKTASNEGNGFLTKIFNAAQCFEAKTAKKLDLGSKLHISCGFDKVNAILDRWGISEFGGTTSLPSFHIPQFQIAEALLPKPL